MSCEQDGRAFTDYGLRTTDYGLRTTDKNFGNRSGISA